MEAFAAFHPAEEARVELTEAARRAREDAMRMLRQTKDEALQTAARAKDEAMSLLHNTKDDALGLARETKDDIACAIRGATDQTVAWFRAHPFAITGVALAAGLVVSRAPGLRGRIGQIARNLAPQLSGVLPRPWNQISQAITQAVSPRSRRAPMTPRQPAEAPV
jgi:ElaB/YqjD/DUF883 family membrane-anchored ribosome-binding protein